MRELTQQMKVTVCCSILSDPPKYRTSKLITEYKSVLNTKYNSVPEIKDKGSDKHVASFVWLILYPDYTASDGGMKLVTVVRSMITRVSFITHLMNDYNNRLLPLLRQFFPNLIYEIVDSRK